MEESLICASFNNTQHPKDNSNITCYKDQIQPNSCYITCDKDQIQPNSCYVLWKNETNNVTIEFQGCWKGEGSPCHAPDRCIGRSSKALTGYFFCCCSKSYCNRNVYLEPIVNDVSSLAKVSPFRAATMSPSHSTPNIASNYTLIYPLTILVVIIMLILPVSLFYKRFRNSKKHKNNISEESVPINNEPNFLSKPIELIEIKAKGKYGLVWKAKLEDPLEERLVAVKTFSQQAKYSWLLEKEVFMLPQFKHPNILQCLGFEEKITDSVLNTSEYWLISEYHELGSLYNYLKTNTLDYFSLIKIFDGIAKGLAYLHEEIPSGKSKGLKPAIAHLDIKSKNVLLKNDLTPRISDFGLSLIFHPDHPNTGLGQVGTRRYMAPEVLEGAVSFSRDVLLRIDIYAAGLVFWESLNRCTGENNCLTPGAYKRPFEDEVGLNPSLECMQETVCQQKKRPAFQKLWRDNPNINLICETISECWDQDAEARLTACCIAERTSHLVKSYNRAVA